ncbi:MAG: M14 family metallopeptidase [Candidatus Aminicenantes bacterium]
MRKKYFFTLGPVLLFTFSLTSWAWAKKFPLTAAEASHFTATSTYQEVKEFINQLQEQTALLRVKTLAVSSEGRAVPLLIIGQPPPSHPSVLRYDHRVPVYIQANIHAGEVEGKEASLMLARNILQEDSPYLEKLVILIAPIFNPDGNEKIDPSHRQNQAGPDKGVGIRYNGQNLDLNRDSMKLESPEMRGLVQNVLTYWDPVLLVDCHTTNGSFHQEPVTYSWPLNPNGNLSIIQYMRQKMLPSVSKILKQKYNTLSIPYGNFMDFKNPEKGWRTFSHLPRFLTNYMGLRSRLAILDENYAYADYKTRVYACYHFLLAILDYCSEHSVEISDLVARADQKTTTAGSQPSEKDGFAVEFDLQPVDEKVTIQGWEMEVLPGEEGWPRVKKTDRKRVFILPYFSDFIPRRTVPFPHAYLIPVQDSDLISKLCQHGLMVERLTQPVNLEVESFLIQEIKASERLYQGHHLNSIKGEYFSEKKNFPAGSYVISTAQPLGNLAVYLLEPESDDGLLVWNFFDRYVSPQWGRRPQVYPVYRLRKPANLAKEGIQ